MSTTSATNLPSSSDAYRRSATIPILGHEYSIKILRTASQNHQKHKTRCSASRKDLSLQQENNGSRGSACVKSTSSGSRKWRGKISSSLMQEASTTSSITCASSLEASDKQHAGPDFRDGPQSSTVAPRKSGGMQWVGCGCTSRREALIPVALVAASAALKNKLGSSDAEQKLWSDARFAELMRNGMRDYEKQIVPVKEQLFSGGVLSGKKVVEVGMGTGPSLSYYARADVASVVGVEPNLAMHQVQECWRTMAPLPQQDSNLELTVARAEAERCGVANRLQIVPGFAESLPLDDECADVIVATMLMCSVKDMKKTMGEFHRVLKPGGKYIFIEHIAAPHGSALSALQTVFDPLQVATACGCHLNRNPLEPIKEAGFLSVSAQHFTLGQTLEEAASAPQSQRRGWTLGTAPRQHFLLSPHLAGIAIKEIA